MKISEDFLKGVEAFLSKNYSLALNYFDILLKFNPKDFNFWFWKGNSLKKLGLYKEAQECFNEALTIEPLFSKAWTERGHLYYQYDNFKEALRCYNVAIHLEQNLPFSVQEKGFVLFPTPWQGKGFVCEKLGLLQEALDCFDEAIRLEPANPITWLKKGEVKALLKDFNEAIKCFDEAIRLDPIDANHWYSKGNALCKITYFDEALDCLNEAIRLNPEFSDPLNSIGNLFKQIGNFEKALFFYDEALKLDPKKLNPLCGKGIIYWELKEYEKSELYFDKALKNDPESALAWHGKGIIKEELGYLHEALVYFNKSIKLEPDYYFAWHGKGNVYNDLGNPVGAIKCYDEAIRLNPDIPFPWYGKFNVFYKDSLPESINCLFRFWFLSSKTKFIKKIYKFLVVADNNNLPLLVAKISESINDWSNFLFSASIILKNANRLKPYIQIEKIELDNNSDKIQGLHTKALLYFFLGYPPDSYKIYDEQLDLGNDSVKLSLQGWYYYLITAQSFCEPFESNLEYSVGEANRALKEGNSTLIDLYYAGHIFLFAGDKTKAQEAFFKSQEFIPSLFMLGYLIEDKHGPIYINLCKKIFEKNHLDEKNKSKKYLSGHFIKSIEKEEIYEMLNDYAIRTEIEQAVTEIREALLDFGFISKEELEDYVTLKFWEEIIISPEKEIVYYKDYRNTLVDNFKNKLISEFSSSGENGNSNIENEILKSKNRKEFDAIQIILNKCECSFKVEEELGVFIEIFFRDIHIDKLNQILNYFWLKEKINSEEQISLLAFSYILNWSKKQKTNRAIPDFSIGLAFDLISGLITKDLILSSLIGTSSGLVVNEIFRKLESDDKESYRNLITSISARYNGSTIERNERTQRYLYPEFKKIVWNYIFELKDILEERFDSEFLGLHNH